MKNYEEMAHDVFQRINEYDVRKKKQRKIAARTVATVCPACIIAVAGFGIWQNGGFSPNIITTATKKPDNQVNNTIAVTGSSIIETSNNAPLTTVVTDSQEIETSDNIPVTIVDTTTGVADVTSGESVVITGGNGIAQIIDSFNMNGFDYVEVCEAKGRAFIIDSLVMSNSERDVFTVKESKYLLLVKKSSGETFLFTLPGSIIVNGKIYSETQISPDNYTEENYLGLAGDFEIISTPFNSVYIGENEEIFTVKENEQFIMLKSSDGETRVFAAF